MIEKITSIIKKMLTILFFPLRTFFCIVKYPLEGMLNLDLPLDFLSNVKKTKIKNIRKKDS